MRVFIHGSCVSRDLLTVLEQHGHSVSFYSPRQSLIGLLRAVDRLASLADATTLTSRFQQRVLDGTLRSDLTTQLATHAESTDVLMWDLVDERLGVYAVPDAVGQHSGYVTRTLELITSGVDATVAETGRLIAFGTDEH